MCKEYWTYSTLLQFSARIQASARSLGPHALLAPLIIIDARVALRVSQPGSVECEPRAPSC